MTKIRSKEWVLRETPSEVQALNSIYVKSMKLFPELSHKWHTKFKMMGKGNPMLSPPKSRRWLTTDEESVKGRGGGCGRTKPKTKPNQKYPSTSRGKTEKILVLGPHTNSYVPLSLGNRQENSLQKRSIKYTRQHMAVMGKKTMKIPLQSPNHRAWLRMRLYPDHSKIPYVFLSLGSKH